MAQNNYTWNIIRQNDILYLDFGHLNKGSLPPWEPKEEPCHIPIRYLNAVK